MATPTQRSLGFGMVGLNVVFMAGVCLLLPIIRKAVRGGEAVHGLPNKPVWWRIMDSGTYIFCEWKSRFWPAKILGDLERPLSKDSKLQVEIFEETEQIFVKYSETKPFLLVELQKISDGLDRSKNLIVTAEELKYRSALCTAMNLLKEPSKGKKGFLDDKNPATSKTCSKAVKHKDVKLYSTSSENLIQKESSDSSFERELEATLKRGKSFSETKRVRLKTLNEPKGQKKPQIKDVSDGRKRKRPEDTSQGQDHISGRKGATSKVLSHNQNTVEEGKFGKTKKGSRLKNRQSSPKETLNTQSPESDETNTRNGNRNHKRLMPQPLEKDSKRVSSTIQQYSSDTEEKDFQRKSKYNQLPLPDFSFAETDFLSSELSMESSSPECRTIRDVCANDDTEEDLQLPVLKLQEEPGSFERGTFVWCKLQRYPYWPSLVKSVRDKEKRASIIFVEECLSDPNASKKSFSVSFCKLKHYDCPEKKELLEIARKDYGKSVDWCDALIADYRIRLGCGSFSDSFLEYCTSAISYPVRKECCKTKLNFPLVCPEKPDPIPHVAESASRVKHKVLPDRSRASRDKANEKLVECIVKHKQAEQHLVGILTGKKKSSWLKKFQLSKQKLECLETYIEDEQQVELVVGYLQVLCEKLNTQSKKLMNGDQTKFILEVMLPEAVIFAISATDGLSYENAEKKFLKGPLLSKRERKQFEKKILEMKRVQSEENL